MGWQEQQAAARAAEQQRQAQQNRMAAQRAESIRKENDASNRRAAQASRDASFAASRARAEAERRSSAAAGTKAHDDFMRRQSKAANSFWGSRSTAASQPSYTPEPVAGTKAKGSSAGALFIVAVIGFFIFIHNDQTTLSKSTQPLASTSNLPAAEARTSPIVQESAAAQTPMQAATPQTATPDNSPAPSEHVPVGPVRKLGDVYVDQEGFIVSNPQETSTLAPITDANQGAPLTKPMTSVSAVYPDEARRQNITGMVRVRVRIDDDGSVHAAELESGNPLLAPAALAAARQWTFNATAPSDRYRISHLDFNFDGK